VSSELDYLIDTHQHVWSTSEREYSWITDDVKVYFDKDFRQDEVSHSIKKLGITGTIYIQAADTYDDTLGMFDSASQYPNIVGIVGWVPLDRPKETRIALDVFTHSSPYGELYKGVRNLTHDYSNPKYQSDDAWILRENVVGSIREVESRDLSLDYVAIKPEHTKSVTKLARLFPNLRIIVDHFAKPDIKNHQWDDWASAMKELSRCPNVFTKFSGLNVLSDWDNWTVADWKPYVEECMNFFGSDRIMMGSDWPFCTMANSYEEVWSAQLEAISHFSTSEQENLRFRTATRAYNL
jgi:L-fuconolactonase